MRPTKNQTPAERKARALIAKRTTAQLLTDFEVTDKMPITRELAMTRGWLMDELESRDPDAFNRWMDYEDKNYRNVSPRQFFTA